MLGPSIPAWTRSRNASAGCSYGFRHAGDWVNVNGLGSHFRERLVYRQRGRSVENGVLEVDTLVIGAGVVGLAVARALAQAGCEVIVLEAGDHFGEGISSRNSEVIHAGIYYPESSLKARLCVEGRKQLYEYCESHKVGYRKCGKWIISTSEAQNKGLEGIQAQGIANGAPLELWDGPTLARQLPYVRSSAGLWSPETGIVDTHGLMLALLGELEDAGGSLVLRSPVERIERSEERRVGKVMRCGRDWSSDVCSSDLPRHRQRCSFGVVGWSNPCPTVAICSQQCRAMVAGNRHSGYSWPDASALGRIGGCGWFAGAAFPG